MKRLSYIITVLVTVIIVITGCNNKRRQNRVYMPDMMYSRAFESYAHHDSTKFTMDPSKRGSSLVYYDSRPVDGTIKRGELFPYTLPNDSIGYKMSATVKNPLDSSLSKSAMTEAGRLYNINCGICHGEKGTANGPLSSKVGSIANLTLPDYVAMADGTMFHSITFGKNNMGSYASQLSREQRWMIIKYVRTLQPKAGAKTTAAVTAAADSATAKK